MKPSREETVLLFEQFLERYGPVVLSIDDGSAKLSYRTLEPDGEGVQTISCAGGLTDLMWVARGTGLLREL